MALRLLPVREFTAATDWSRVTAGYDHTCGVKEHGALYCWGGNSHGQVGDGTATLRLVPTRELSSGNDWARVEGSHEHTCALKSDGSLWCWGEGTWGQLAQPVPFGPVAPPPP